MAGLEPDDFAEPQAAVIHECEHGAETPHPHRAEELRHLVAREHVGQLLLTADLDLAPSLPVAPEVVAVETAQGTGGLVDRRVLQAPLVAKRDEEIEHLALGERGDVAAGQGIMEPAHPGDIGFARARRDVPELDKPHELLIPLRRSESGVVVLVAVDLFFVWLVFFAFIAPPA